MFGWCSAASRLASSQNCATAFGSIGQLGPQALDDDRAPEAAFPLGDGRVDLGHAALADALDDRVAADRRQPPRRATAAGTSAAIGASDACRDSIT